MKRHSIRLPQVALLGGTAAYAFAVRPRVSRWGATDEEVTKPLPGDELVSSVGYRPISTRATTIDAPPEAVWPWLVQMGSASPANTTTC